MPAPSKNQKGEHLTKANEHHPGEEKKYKCDLCTESFKAPTALGMHKRLKHGIAGKSKAAIGYRNAKNLPPKPRDHQCPVCEFKAATQGGLTKHMNATHKNGEGKLAKVNESKTHQAVLSGQNGFTAHTDDEAHRLEAVATFTAGRITELLTGIAISNDLPPRSLAALVLRTLGQTAKVR